jgi:hypothetical protein
VYKENLIGREELILYTPQSFRRRLVITNGSENFVPIVTKKYHLLKGVQLVEHIQHVANLNYH